MQQMLLTLVIIASTLFTSLGCYEDMATHKASAVRTSVHSEVTPQASEGCTDHHENSAEHHCLFDSCHHCVALPTFFCDNFENHVFVIHSVYIFDYENSELEIFKRPPVLG